MKKILFISILTLSVTFSFSQTLNETIDWITRESDGREQVKYDKETNTLFLISVRQMDKMVSFVNEISPNDVKSISVKNNGGGWQLLNLNLKREGVDITYYTLDHNFELISEIKNQRQYGIGISIECDETLINKFKKAYIHLFKLLGVEVKDGDMF